MDNAPQKIDLPVKVNAGSHQLEADLISALQEGRSFQSEINRLRKEIANARNYPLKEFYNRNIYKILKSLSKKSYLFSERRRLRFLQSAAKLDPNRSLVGTPNQYELKSEITGNELSIKGFQAFDAGKKNVLVVAHEASQTGAPILSYNISKHLTSQYNVTVIFLRGGILSNVFRDVACHVEVLQNRPRGDNSSARRVRGLVAKTKFHFAIINSIESRSILPILKSSNVASVSLIHEFATYTSPRHSFDEVFEAADEIVFSSEVTMSNAIELTNLSANPQIHIIPQGKTQVPKLDTTEEATNLEKKRLKYLMRAGEENKDFVVIGSGTVDFRKGVDLFIEAARVASARAPSIRMRFYWFGAGYDVARDQNYSVYLEDQIKRAGLSDKLTIAGHTTEIDYAYSLADAFLLSSRLDPLPNVAMDAMIYGIPMICFDNASGFSPILNSNGLGDSCVASYLDAADMGYKLAEIAKDQDLCRKIGLQSKQIAFDNFNMQKYVESLSELGEHAAKKIKAG
ncbi:glycosyltransferase family 4 protein [Falsigemmobacter faecalis]|nr:glycosyltransferase family 4 protein [Falsigemmobacter faecalis]